MQETEKVSRGASASRDWEGRWGAVASGGFW